VKSKLCCSYFQQTLSSLSKSRVKHEELVFLCKALIGILVYQSAREDAFIVLTQDS